MNLAAPPRNPTISIVGGVKYIDGKDAECLYNQIMNGEPSTETDEQAMKKIAEEDARLRTLEANGAQI